MPKDLYVWTANAPAVKADPDLMFALCAVQPGSTAERLKLKQKEPLSEEASLHCFCEAATSVS